VIVIAATLAGSRLIPAGASASLPTDAPPSLQPFFRFDATWYESLWHSGYAGPLAAYHAASYPVYPALVRVIGSLGIGAVLASLLISNLAFAVALFLLYRIASRHLEPRVAALSIWVLALWPWAIFYSYPMGESVELLLIAAAFLLMERGAWLWSGVVAAITGASRPTGILTSLAYAGEFIARVRTEEGRRGIPRVVIAGLLSTLGLIAFCLILLHQIGDPFGFLHAQRFWQSPHTRNPLFPLTSTARILTRHDIFDTEAAALPVILAFAAALVWSVRRLPLRYATWGAGFLLVAILDGYYIRSLAAGPRHLLEWFPIYFAIAVLLSRPRLRLLQPVWLIGSAALLAVYAAMFGSWHFVS
jgi:hypothetical protein